MVDRRKWRSGYHPPENFEKYWYDLVHFGYIHSLKYQTKMGFLVSNFTIFIFFLWENIHNKSCFLLSLRFFQVNSMKVDKYFYMISESEIMGSSRYAKKKSPIYNRPLVVFLEVNESRRCIPWHPSGQPDDCYRSRGTDNSVIDEW